MVSFARRVVADGAAGEKPTRQVDIQGDRR